MTERIADLADELRCWEPQERPPIVALYLANGWATDTDMRAALALLEEMG